MKFDPNFILKGINGENLEGEIDNIHAGKILAQGLFHATDNRLKFYDWAVKLYAQQPIELDNADRKLLRKYIEESKLPAITYAPLINLLDAED